MSISPRGSDIVSIAAKLVVVAVRLALEAEGGRQWPIPFVRRSSGIRRESSLATALQKSTERLVLVQGEPGSGKSVALRHVAYQLADKASYERRLDTKLPVYVNLKENCPHK